MRAAVCDYYPFTTPIPNGVSAGDALRICHVQGDQVADGPRFPVKTSSATSLLIRPRSQQALSS